MSFLGNICCCFNANVCCGWYTPRPFLIHLIVLFSLYECLSWLIFGVLWVITPHESIATDLYWFFSYFNPFIKRDECAHPESGCRLDIELHRRNLRTLINFFVICIPQIGLMYFKAYKGLVAWAKNFEIKATERFYRISFTYYTYLAFIKMLIILEIGPSNQTISVIT